MRPQADESPLPWPARVFKPWIVASVAGACLGTALLTMRDGEPVGSYSEPPPRAAVKDLPATPVIPSSDAPGSVEMEPTPITGLVDGAASVPAPILDTP